jgi:hypothetical protein
MGWFGDDLPRTSADIELLEGSPSELRSCANDLRTLAGELQPAWTACVQLTRIADGTSWNGDAFNAYRSKVDKNPTAADIDNAQSMMNQAAGTLDTLASGVEECQGRIQWCRQRIDALGLPEEGDIPEDKKTQVETIKRDAEDARSDYEGHLNSAGRSFEDLTDRTVYAEPPPGFWEKVGNAVVGGLKFVGDFLVGIVEGVYELVKGLVMIVAFVVQPWKWPEAWDTIVMIAKYAYQDPMGFLKMVGSAMIDLETLKENPAKWLGKLVPNIALAILTGGAGTAASVLSRVGAFASRFSRLARVVDKMNSVAKVATKVDKFGRADNMARRLGLARPLTRAERNANNRAMGEVGNDLSQAKWQGMGYRPVAQEVTLRSNLFRRPSGVPWRARVDHVFADDGGGGLFGVESKNGLTADYTDGQRVVYPEMESTGVEVRSDALAGEGFPSGSNLKAPVHTDRWYSPHDAPGVGTQLGVQTGAETVSAGAGDRYDVPAST